METRSSLSNINSTRKFSTREFPLACFFAIEKREVWDEFWRNLARRFRKAIHIHRIKRHPVYKCFEQPRSEYLVCIAHGLYNIKRLEVSVFPLGWNASPTNIKFALVIYAAERRNVRVKYLPWGPLSCHNTKRICATHRAEGDIGCGLQAKNWMNDTLNLYLKHYNLIYGRNSQSLLFMTIYRQKLRLSFVFGAPIVSLALQTNRSALFAQLC